MAVFTQTVTLNGVTNFSIFGRNYEWDDRFLDRFRVRLDDGDRGSLTLNLTSTFDIETARFGGDIAFPLTIRDIGGGERHIATLILSEGNSTLRLTRTEVDVIRGFGDNAVYDLSIAREVNFIDLSTGNRTILNLAQGAGVVELDDSNDTVTTNGSINALNLGRGTNTVQFRGDSFDAITFGSGRTVINFTGDFGGAITGYGETGSTSVITIGAGASVRSVGVSNGRDTLVLAANASVSQATLGSDNDILRMALGSQMESANIGSGNNTVTMTGARMNALTAYNGSDKLTMSNSDIGTVDLGSGANTVVLTGGAEIGLYRSFEGNDIINFAGGRIDVVQAGSGNNRITTGSDFTQGIFAYEGNDTVTVGSGGAGMVKLDGGNNTVTAQGFVDSILTFDGVDRVTLTEGARYLDLGDGNDSVTSTGFVRTVTLGGNDDEAILSDGADYVDAGSGNDTVTSSGYVDMLSLGNNDDVATLSGGASQVNGGSGNDTVTISTEGVNHVSLGSGNDTLIQGPIDGGGSSVLFGGSGIDTIDLTNYGSLLSNGEIGLEISLANFFSYQQVGPDSAPDFHIINGFENLITGVGDDILTGSDQANRLNGGQGTDTLAGGTGADVFVFADGGWTDVVTDFELGIDRLRMGTAVDISQITVTDDGADAVVTGGGVSVRVLGVDHLALNQAANFEF